jgi:glyoxylate reductase
VHPRGQRGEWEGWSPTWMLGRRITGKRLGIVGMGRIGQAVARRAKAFGLSIHYHNRRRVAAADRGTARSDLLGFASTRCWRAWTSSRSTARIRRRPITCCRRAGWRSCKPTLSSSTPRAARSSTRRRSPNASAKPGRSRAPGSTCSSTSRWSIRSLLKLARQQGKVVLLPHMGSATIEGRIDMGEKVIINIRTYFDGHRPPDRVLPGRD